MGERLRPFADARAGGGARIRRHGRLFIVACCRRVWELFRDERCRKAVETGEQFARDAISSHELARVRLEAEAARKEAEEREAEVGGWSSTPSMQRSGARRVRLFPPQRRL